jgi:predicted small secreted protein
MNQFGRLIFWLLVLIVALTAAGCNESGGIGIGVPVSGGGARWGTGSSGPDVLVGGGPSFR